MSKLNQEELLDCLKEWKHRREWMGEWNKEDEQAYQQIIEMIQKPEVTEEWIEEKARRLIECISVNDIQSLEGWKGFIRLLVEEIHGRKQDKF